MDDSERDYYEPSRTDMLAILRANGVTTPRVLDAMSRVPRERFVRHEDRPDAYADRAMPIEYGQTISQPLMVAILVQALELHDGDKVLDIGTGSGYQAAVIAECGAEVLSIERIEGLASTARDRLDQIGYHVDVRIGDGGVGAPDRAPFDAIAVAAGVPNIPAALFQQLAEGGRLVVPVRTDDDIDELLRV